MFNFTDTQKIGAGLAGMGVAFIFLGILLFFDKGLLAIGNLLFLSGLAFIIGMKKTIFFFFQRSKIKASSFFFLGIVIVFLGWPIIGMIAELYGFVLLFGGFLPNVVYYIRRLPGLNIVLNLPVISTIVDKLESQDARTRV
ncbi:vesicle transport protein GOT1B [Daphnia magna]|uniref:Vesicle transport protein GOT1B n=1 Tax=Daphnia magna TaxID=35525 RepID=A0A0P6DXC1_9CRUS|nr:vesicle transport protein GOT1B [Daphnia magna]KZS13682.1 Uncharacterized protein APZ42_021044 [Daphnia magna]